MELIRGIPWINRLHAMDAVNWWFCVEVFCQCAASLPSNRLQGGDLHTSMDCDQHAGL